MTTLKKTKKRLIILKSILRNLIDKELRFNQLEYQRRKETAKKFEKKIRFIFALEWKHLSKNDFDNKIKEGMHELHKDIYNVFKRIQLLNKTQAKLEKKCYSLDLVQFIIRYPKKYGFSLFDEKMRQKAYIKIRKTLINKIEYLKKNSTKFKQKFYEMIDKDQWVSFINPNLTESSKHEKYKQILELKKELKFIDESFEYLYFIKCNLSHIIFQYKYDFHFQYQSIIKIETKLFLNFQIIRDKVKAILNSN